MKPVLVTRAEPGASRTVQRLTALGFTALNAATARIILLRPDVRPDPGEALALTSPNGAHAAAQLSDHRTMAVFAVGDATAEAARGEGFTDVMSAEGDGAALARLILRRWSGSVLHVRGRDQGFDLTEALTRAGVSARSAIAYAAQPVDSLGRDALAALSAGAVILAHSPKGAERFAALAAQAGAGADLRRAAAAAISPAAAAPLERAGVTRIELAAKPDESALFDALQRALS